MTSPPNPQPRLTAPAKAIPPARDRLQSRLLVCVVTPLLLPHLAQVLIDDWIAADVCIHFHAYSDSLGSFDRYTLEALAVSLAFAILAWATKAATPAAAVCGGLICLEYTHPDLIYGSRLTLLHTPLPALALLFLFTFLATRFRRAKKEACGIAEPRTGRRASQVVANLGIVTLFPLLRHGHVLPVPYLAAVAALAEATADTLSSEIGQAVAGPAFLITTLRRVPPGTDGAVSLAGTLAGLLGAVAVIYVALPAHSFKLLLFVAIFAASTLGLFFDSLLGATLERRGHIGNDLVNFASTAFAAAILYPIAHIVLSSLRI